MRRLFELRTILFAVVLLVTLFLVLYPVLLIIFYSFSSAEAGADFVFGLDAWHRALSEPAMFGSIVNTIKLLVAIHVIAFPVAVLIAWTLARTDIPWRGGLEFMFWISFFLPSLSVTLGWIMCLDPQYGVLNRLIRLVLPLGDTGPFNIYSFWGIVWAHLAANAIAVKVMLLTPTFRNIDSSLEEASRVAGAGRLATLVRIVVPAMLPALIAILLLAMIRAMQSFEIEMVLGPPFQFYVYSTKVYTLISRSRPTSALPRRWPRCASPRSCALIFTQRWFAMRRQFTTLTGSFRPAVASARGASGVFRHARRRAHAHGHPAGVRGAGVDHEAVRLFQHPVPLYPRPLADRVATRPSANPWSTRSRWRVAPASSGGAGLADRLLHRRTTFRARALLDFVSWLPFAVPGILFGVGLLYVFLNSPLFRPLYGTMVLLIIATTISSLTLGTQIIKST